MRKSILLLSTLFIIHSVNAQITWDGGGGDNQWNTAANWVGDIVPVAGNNVLLDNSVVAGNYTVMLPAGAVTVSVGSLIITPAGSNISLLLPNTNTANLGLTVTGAGDALVLNNGAILKNSSGVTSGVTLSITSTFRINNGGHYIHNTRGANAAIINQISTVAGTELGEFEFDVPTASYILSLAGRTFGNLTLTALANGGTASYSGSGGTALTIKGNLKINTGTSFSMSMSANTIIHGNFIQAASSAFNLQTSTNTNTVKVKGDITSAGTITESNTGLPTLELEGTSNQNITITGNINNSITLAINNPAGATLLAPLTLPFDLQLTNGKIKTTGTNLLTMSDNANYTGGSSTSFIEGPLKKIGDEDFLFPVGAGSIYAPAGIAAGGGATVNDEFTAEYKRSSPQGQFGTNYASGINHISYVEYWDILRGPSTTATKKIMLTVTAQSFCKKISNTFVSHLNGTQWSNEASTSNLTGTSGANELGTVTTNGIVSSFSPFTLATDLTFSANPLPLNLLTFEAVKSGNNKVSLKWTLAENPADAAIFEVEKSIDKTTFISFNKINGDLAKRSYTSEDNQLSKGITYYRLKMTDENGKITYSKIVTIVNNETGVLITSLWPNPVQNNILLTINANTEGKQNIIIYDMMGNIVKQENIYITKGENKLNIEVGKLSAGVYYISAATGGTKSVSRFVKQ